MSHRIVYTQEDTDFLENEHDYAIEEAFDFDGLRAVVVASDEDPAEIFDRDERIAHVDPDMEFTIEHGGGHGDDGSAGDIPEKPPSDTEGLAEMVDYRDKHAFPEDAPGNGAGVTVAVMDSGVTAIHPVFENTLVRTENFVGDGKYNDSIGHGSAVAGQIVRLAPEAELWSLRVFGDSGKTSMKVLLRAYQHLFDHADRYDVVNMSLGSSKTSEYFNRIHDKLEQKGIRNVVAAGNSGGAGGSPATAETAFSVGACDEDGNMADFSSYNPDASNPEVTAIGKNNKLVEPSKTDVQMGEDLNGRWVKASGTSFSAPLVTGFVACLLSVGVENPRQRLKETAEDIPGTDRDGAGLVKYEEALPDDVGPEQETTHGDVWNFGGGDTLYLKADWLPDGDYTVEKAENDEGHTVLTFVPKAE